MAILEILHYPDNRLRQKCENVEDFDKSLEVIVGNMLETMYDAKGIGLAAIQVNIIKRIIVIDISEKRNCPIILINPEIISKKEKMEPWLVPIRSNMRKIYNKPLILDKLEKDENILMKSWGHPRQSI